MRPDLESAIEHLPGLASLALWCRFSDAGEEEAIAYTDGSTIYAGNGYEKFAPKERRFICLHEILHIALCHTQRAEQLKRRDPDFDSELLNIAADAIINSSLENLTALETPSDAWTLAKIWQVLDENITEKERAMNAMSSSASSPASNVITLNYSYGAQSQSKKIANLTRSEFTRANRWSCEELYYFLKAQTQSRANFLACLIAAYGKDALGGDLRPKDAKGEQTTFDARINISKTDNAQAADEKREWQQRLALLRGTCVSFPPALSSHELFEIHLRRTRFATIAANHLSVCLTGEDAITFFARLSAASTTGTHSSAATITRARIRFMADTLHRDP